MTSSRKFIGFSLATLILFAILCSLGVWQLQRKAWKEALIAQVEARASGAPADLKDIPPEWRDPKTVDGADFARVAAKGIFDNNRELLMISAQRNGAGWMVITRFDTEEGAVLVMRGVVPDRLKNPAMRADGQLAGEVSIIGRIRMPEQAGSFTPANDVARNQWFWRDLAGMQRATGIHEASRAPPFFIELEQPVPPGGWPRPQLDEINLRNDHLQYAITWFALAGVTVVMFGLWLRSQLRPHVGKTAANDA
ncbi:SURF1 family protein [Terrarubrum flagellatum]|uniref:SURF1 family protein n=1 Tax=Terrirubrum flagellatum TaxID=2895980 RepID=UPI003144FAAB